MEGFKGVSNEKTRRILILISIVICYDYSAERRPDRLKYGD